jgi:hypothetical protein
LDRLKKDHDRSYKELDEVTLEEVLAKIARRIAEYRREVPRVPTVDEWRNSGGWAEVDLLYASVQPFTDSIRRPESPDQLD